MIKSISTTQILDHPILPFTFSKSQLSDAEKASVSVKKVFHYQFEEDVYAVEPDLFFKTLMRSFVEERNLYFFYVDKVAEPQYRLRSHKKLLYAHRDRIGQDQLYEEEVELRSGETVLYSIVRVDESNLDYVCAHLVNSLFAFGLVKDLPNRGDYYEGLSLRSLIQSQPPSSRGLFDINLLKVVAHLVDESSSVIRVFKDGLDNDYLSLFYENEQHLSIMEAMKKRFKVKGG